MHLHHQFIEMDSPKWHTMLFGGKMYSHFLLFLGIYLYTLLPISWFVLNWKVSLKRFKVCNILFLFPMSRKNPFLELFVKHKFWNWVKCFWMCLNLDINKSVSLSIFFCKDSAFFWRKEGKFIPKVDSTKNRPVFGLPTELWKLRCLKWNTSIKTLSSYNIFHVLDSTLGSRFCLL